MIVILAIENRRMMTEKTNKNIWRINSVGGAHSNNRIFERNIFVLAIVRQSSDPFRSRLASCIKIQFTDEIIYITYISCLFCCTCSCSFTFAFDVYVFSLVWCISEVGLLENGYQDPAGIRSGIFRHFI